jgi:hypothetical protein
MRVPWRGYAQRRRRSFRAICFQCMRLGQEIDGMVTASRIDLEICWNFRGSWGCLRWLLHVAAHSWHRCTRLSQKLINDIYIYYDIICIYVCIYKYAYIYIICIHMYLDYSSTADLAKRLTIAHAG